MFTLYYDACSVSVVSSGMITWNEYMRLCLDDHLQQHLFRELPVCRSEHPLTPQGQKQTRQDYSSDTEATVAEKSKHALLFFFAFSSPGQQGSGCLHTWTCSTHWLTCRRVRSLKWRNPSSMLVCKKPEKLRVDAVKNSSLLLDATHWNRHLFMIFDWQLISQSDQIFFSFFFY